MSNIEVAIHLDKFKARDYQKPVCDAFLNKGYKKILLIWPRRCLHGETHITMADGSFKLLKDIRPGDSILSWNGSSFEPDVVKNGWITESKKTLNINAKAWPTIITSEDHLFAACYQNCNVNWYKASDLKPLHQLQVYGGIECGSLHDPDLAEFIGYMITDGYVSGHQQPKFTNINIEILKRVEYLALKLFGIIAIWRPKGNAYDLGLTNGSKGGGYTPNKVKMLFRDYSLDVPKNVRPIHPLVWQFDRESLGRFLSAVLSCDGSIYTHKESIIHDTKRDRHSVVKPYTEISISCGKSHSYGWGMYWLLRKIGIQPQVPKLEHGGSNLKISIGRHDQIKTLLSYGPIYGKEDKQKISLDIIENRELTPYILYNGCYRSRIDEIKPGLTSDLYDIETEKNHNFVANGYVVHNSGKDLVCFNLLLRAALKKVGIYYAIYPTFSQAKRIVWDGLTNTGFKFLDFIPKELIESTNSTEMKVILKNGSLLQLVGSTDYDKLMGTNISGCIFSEFGLTDGQAYGYIRPMLNANDGFCMVISTPRGHNALWEMYGVAINNPEWFVSKLTLDDTRHIDPMIIENEVQRGEISRDLALQEYWTSFSCGQAGSFYGNTIDRIRVKGQISRVPYESHLLVNTAWDIGLDTTALIFFQVLPTGSVHLIDFYENQNLSLEHYMGILKAKPYIYGKHIGPHDLANREFSSGVSRLDLARRLDVKFVLAPNIAVADGIEAGRALLSKTYIDEVSCKDLIRHLENYRQEYDEKRKTYTGKPLHNIDSHACFTGDTNLLTRSGMRQIMLIEENEEVLTLSGWVRCTKAVKTRTNVNVVEVSFEDGMRVKCTGEHLFLTASGWKSAKKLTNGTEIQSSLTRLLPTLMEIYIEYGRMNDTQRTAGRHYTEMHGNALLDLYQKAVIYITEIMIPIITTYGILSVCQRQNILNCLGLIAKDLAKKLGIGQPNGIDLTKADYGIADMLERLRAGKNSKESLEIALTVEKNFFALFGKVLIHKDSVIQLARPCIIEKVNWVKDKYDVYDITTENAHFTLYNGSIVHNSDAFRMLAVALPKVSLSTTADDLDKRYKAAMYGEQNQLPRFFRDGI